MERIVRMSLLDNIKEKLNTKVYRRIKRIVHSEHDASLSSRRILATPRSAVWKNYTKLDT